MINVKEINATVFESADHHSSSFSYFVNFTFPQLCLAQECERRGFTKLSHTNDKDAIKSSRGLQRCHALMASFVSYLRVITR